MLKCHETTCFADEMDNSIHTVNLQRKLFDLGINLDLATGHLFYRGHFKPLVVDFELVLVRHGETFGNCGQSTVTGKIDNALVKAGVKDNEKRIYQGNIDTEINQLTEFGKTQALAVAEELKTNFLQHNWQPDIVFTSPLSRAKDTAFHFISHNKFENRFVIHNEITEMSFGLWENRRVCDIPSDHYSHLFYRAQNALVKSSTLGGNHCHSENFCDVLLRAYKVIMNLNKNYAGKKIVMFSHSMFGAACCILFGKGQKIEDDNYLAFDGKRKDNTYYTIPNAIPYILNFEIRP